MTELVARLKVYLDYKKLGVIDLSISLGYNSPQKLYRLFNTENANPSCQIIEDIANKYYDLDLNWLFTGRGEMLMETMQNINFKEKYYDCLVEKEALYKKLIRK